MTYLTIVVHILLAISLIVLVLLQQGKGAEAGAAFGGGASQTVFGSRGSTGFLAKFTGVLVALFFITSLLLARFAYKTHEVVTPAAQQQTTEEPADAPVTSNVEESAAQAENKSAKVIDATPASVDNAAPVQNKAPASQQTTP